MGKPLKNSKKKKEITVQKFGGTEKIADMNIARDPYEINTIEAQSKTKLDSDTGHGIPVVIRQFTFGLNPEIWRLAPPTKQQLLNHHLKGIEISLWRDGLKPFTEVEPRIVVDEKKMQYSIFITAVQAKGHLLNYNPLTLKEIAQH